MHEANSHYSTHIVPPVDDVDGRIMVLPLLTPLLHFLCLDASGDDIGALAMQFMEGVAYLHHSSVAHLDLKPSNIVVQRDRKSKEVDLYIIDFNNAAFADVEQTISKPVGTPGWCAPEITAGNPYDPLLADRWSCGRGLALFTERMKESPLRATIRVWSQLLMNPEPSVA